MLAWLQDYWGVLLATVICGAYFAFYVVLARDRRANPDTRPRKEKDC